MDNDQDKTAIDYVLELVKTQGVGVATVKDGWVLTFKKAKLKELLDRTKDDGLAIIFVQSSAKLPQN